MNDDDIARIIHCKFTYEIWSHLIVIHEGTSQVKRAKIDLLRPNMNFFFMNKNESINDMITKFTKIITDLTSLGDELTMTKK